MPKLSGLYIQVKFCNVKKRKKGPKAPIFNGFRSKKRTCVMLTFSFSSKDMRQHRLPLLSGVVS